MQFLRSLLGHTCRAPIGCEARYALLVRVGLERDHARWMRDRVISCHTSRWCLPDSGIQDYDRSCSVRGPSPAQSATRRSTRSASTLGVESTNWNLHDEHLLL